MFDDLKESWYVSKVEAVIQTEINKLPLMFRNHTEGLAHGIVLYQYKVNAVVFGLFSGERLNPTVVAAHSVLMFIDAYGFNGTIIVNGEDCLGTLKIICMNLMVVLDTAPLDNLEVSFLENFSAPIFNRIFADNLKGSNFNF
ncbi:hypothetical protein V4836_08155 [Kluyvera ascorbata]|uniref:Uncharacterized protein n=1 Tax=Kluyvera ascorbata TaxID=51288 RepID=A0AB35X4D2_9ENTR